MEFKLEISRDNSAGSYNEVELFPHFSGGAAVVPGSQQAEEVFIEISLQQPVGFIHGQDDGGIKGW